MVQPTTQSSPKRNSTGGRGGWGYSGVVIVEVTKSSMRSSNTWGWGSAKGIPDFRMREFWDF